MSESTDQVSEDGVNDPNKVIAESNGGEQQSPASNQSGESVQGQTEDSSQKGERSWKTRINKAWKIFKYYCNPMNWFSYWKS
ncbi:hypothetical protein R2618_05665 [Streptococcus pyogenes]|uniref:hypothetical protein n=1 Tax=Streptococcus pyogenes TaxID=1314 RepID=UPI0003AE547B|nr:hypothetical protein [Streptococcus pyogenes]ERL06474.1 hypothetical protein HMPREF1231_1324 [Streptococcus pyogenes GA06023]HER4616571.1 hypothetical protein [Streptococcus pyogenes NGAS535]ESA56720.1 hypothetical protein HMPREF1239_0959 [Streptococcus pyogenes GA03805]WSE72995.1 hypothetical protein VKP36_08645 [Streptococcus pyogenes]SQE98517.1 Uncharacterised protein [Streptococcus pyogenes]